MMRVEVLTVATTLEEAERDLKELSKRYETGALSIQDIYDETGVYEGLGVVWEVEK